MGHPVSMSWHCHPPPMVAKVAWGGSGPKELPRWQDGKVAESSSLGENWKGNTNTLSNRRSSHVVTPYSQSFLHKKASLGRPWVGEHSPGRLSRNLRCRCVHIHTHTLNMKQSSPTSKAQTAFCSLLFSGLPAICHVSRPNSTDGNCQRIISGKTQRGIFK